MTPLLLFMTLSANPAPSHPVLPAINLIPLPKLVQPSQDGSFKVGKTVTLSYPSTCAFEGRATAELLRKSGARVLTVDEKAGSAMVSLTDQAPRTDNPTAGSYELSVKPSGVQIRAGDPAGVFYGVQTLRQLMPAELEAHAVKDVEVPSVEIADSPRFAWRGMLLDVSRHFFPPRDIKHFLDLLAMQKMNVFHWHLVDDGGWRIQIKRYPNLTEQGAWRKTSKQVWDYQHLSFPPKADSSKRYGGFYTQDQIREIVQYAAERHITIVPEIEMPGHSLAALASYPALGCNVTDADFQKASGMPSKNVYCAGKEESFKFLENVLDEVFELFPSKIVHIGGDEVDKYLWNHCPDCQKRMADEHLANAEELQSYFIKRIEKYVNSKGRRLMGWDEILQGGLAPNAAVMSWRGIDGGIAAANDGHDVVMTPTSHCYFDYPYTSISSDHVLGFEPVPPVLSGQPASSHILGAQCNLWTEMVPDRATAEQRLFPRILAMAEVLWSGTTSPESFDPRLDGFYPRLQAMGLNFYLPKPEAEFDAVMMDPSAKIVLKPSPIAGAVIRYTTDGSIPTASSKVYSGPLSAAVPQTVTAATFLATGQVSEAMHVEVASQSVDSVDALKPGLAYSIYDGDWSKTPDFTTLKASMTGETPNVGLVGGKLESYAIGLNGVISVPKDGIYRFFLSSDDGSIFWLGGARVVDNDGLHGAIEKSGRIYLKAGSYPIRIGYFQAGGGQSLSLAIEGPDLEKQPVPNAWLRH